MTDDEAKVLDCLPGKGPEVVHRAARYGFTREQTYQLLVRMFDRGEVSLMPPGDGTVSRVWQ